MNRQTRKKKGSRVVEKIQKEQRVGDDTVMDLAQKDDRFHESLNDLHSDVMREMRCKTLQKKKENGGLSPEEEDELAKLGGC